MSMLRALAGLAIFILGLYAAWTLTTGLASGEIMQFSKHGNAIFYKTAEPNRYWIAISFWTIASIMLVGGGINMIRKNL